MKLSVIIPAHNPDSSVKQTLRSVFEQHVPGLEVVVVDDGSDLPLTATLGELAAHPDVRVVRQEKLGVSVARNRGFSESTGDYVMFVDADDLLVPDTLNPFLDVARASNADVTISDFYLRRDDFDELVPAVNSERHTFSREDRTVLQWLTLARVGFAHKSNVGLLGAPWAKIYSRSFLQRTFERSVLFQPGVLRGQDVLFNTEVFGNIERVQYWPAATYAYVISEWSASHRAADDFAERVEHLAACTDRLLRENRWDSVRPALAKMIVTLLEETIQRAASGNARDSIRDLLRRPTFADAVRAARQDDFGMVGRVKLWAFRVGPLTTLAVLSALAWLRDRQLHGWDLRRADASRRHHRGDFKE